MLFSMVGHKMAETHACSVPSSLENPSGTAKNHIDARYSTPSSASLRKARGVQKAS